MERNRPINNILNEVLSLNAQEFTKSIPRSESAYILNEVLSLNAQESPSHRR